MLLLLFQKAFNDAHQILDRRDLYFLLTAVYRAPGKATLNEKEEIYFHILLENDFVNFCVRK